MGRVQRTIVQDEVAFLLSLPQARRITGPQFAICRGSSFLRSRCQPSLNQEIVRIAALPTLICDALHYVQTSFECRLAALWLRASQFIDLIIS